MSIEAFHKASLVHDDIEDDDPFHYGEESVHNRYGIPTAINIGDYSRDGLSFCEHRISHLRCRCHRGYSGRSG